MASLIATREALERFKHELPVAGLLADRLRRYCDATLAMVTQSLSIERASTEWIDHNLAVILSDSLEDTATRASGQVLFNGIRRRLSDALAHDPDDLGLALALALGARGALDDERTSRDIELVAMALQKPQAGARLLRSAVSLIVSGAAVQNPRIEHACEEALAATEEALNRFAARLPHHPEHGIHRIELMILAARKSGGSERREKLETAHALAKDYSQIFGETEAVQRCRVSILEQLARTEGAKASSVGQDAWELLNVAIRGEALSPKKALRLLRTLSRAGEFNRDRATKLLPRFEALAGERKDAWSDVFAMLLESTGNQAGLVSLWEERLRTKPSDKSAAKGLAEKLVSNLRRQLKAPFELVTLGAVLDAVPPGTLARWNASDIGSVLTLTKEGFGPQRALDFLVHRVLRVKEHKRRTSLWDTALAMAKDVDDGTYLDVARIAMDAGRHDGARLAVATILSQSETTLEEAQDTLRPLLDSKGEIGARAQDLHRTISGSPALRGSQRQALLAFEEAIGVGTSKVFELRVTHTGQNYVLVEVVDRPAPRFYDHKYLRVMIRADELPRGVPFAALKKGDALTGPIRGQDADPKKDKNLRLYWIADASKLTTNLAPEALVDRLHTLEQTFGVGTGETVRLKIGWEENRTRLVVRLYGRTGKAEFPIRPVASVENLPEGTKPQDLGRGKRAWGVVDVEANGSARVYRVKGVVSFQAPETERPETDRPMTERPETERPETERPETERVVSEPSGNDVGGEDAAVARDEENVTGTTKNSETLPEEAIDGTVETTTLDADENPNKVDIG